MYAVEFNAKPINGTIRLPKQLKDMHDNVRVLVLVEDVPEKEKDDRSRLSRFQNTITLPVDPLQFQRKMRNEWK